MCAWDVRMSEAVHQPAAAAAPGRGGSPHNGTASSSVAAGGAYRLPGGSTQQRLGAARLLRVGLRVHAACPRGACTGHKRMSLASEL